VLPGQSEDAETFGNVLFEPGGEIGSGLAIGGDGLFEQGFGEFQSRGVKELAQLAGEVLAQSDPGDVLEGILLEMELATLPQDAREARATSGLEAGVIVADDEERTMEAALLE